MRYRFSAEEIGEIRTDLIAARSFLEIRGDARGRYADAYAHVVDFATDGLGFPEYDRDRASLVWFSGAEDVNRNDGIFSYFIRNYTISQYEIRTGRAIEDGAIQAASDGLADSVLDTIVLTGRLPSLNQIAEVDAATIADSLFSGDRSGWSGNLLFLALGHDESFFENIIGNGRDTYEIVVMYEAADVGATSSLAAAQAGLLSFVTRLASPFLSNWFGPEFSVAAPAIAQAIFQLDDVYQGYAADFLFLDKTIDKIDSNSRINGDSDSNFIHLGNGNDRSKGRAGDDFLDGSYGNDRLSGDRGDDKLFGSFGDDWLSGGVDDDVLFGGAGKDTIRGGSGDDILSGQRGRDTLFGGTGTDTYIFSRNDTIIDPDNENILLVTGPTGPRPALIPSVVNHVVVEADDDVRFSTVLRGTTNADYFRFDSGRGDDEIRIRVSEETNRLYFQTSRDQGNDLVVLTGDMEGARVTLSFDGPRSNDLDVLDISSLGIDGIFPGDFVLDLGPGRYIQVLSGWNVVDVDAAGNIDVFMNIYQTGLSLDENLIW